MATDRSDRTATSQSEDNLDLVGLYFQDVAQHPILTREQERKLLADLDEVDGTPCYPSELKQVQNRLVESNLRLVVMLAKGFQDRGLSLPDLIQEGNIGLLNAASRFDRHRGVRFSTYAAWWIKQAIRRALVDKAPTIRVSGHRVNQLSQAKRAKEQLQRKLGRQPTEAEVGKVLGVTAAVMHQINTSVPKVTSFEDFSADENITREVPISDLQNNSPLERLAHIEARQAIQKALASLTPREAQVLIGRYGLHGQGAQTLAKVGQHLSLTREGVRLIQERALDKLKRGHDRYGLMAWWRTA